MQLHNRLKEELKTTSKEIISKKLGYTSASKGLNSLDSFLTYQSLNHWLRSGFYDFKYDAKEYFIQLCQILSIPKEDMETELKYQKKLSDEINSFSDSDIYINTDFKRITQPLNVLALMEHTRRIAIPKEALLFKTDTEIFKIISNLVKEHYLTCKGELALWGEICNYVYYHRDKKTYVFDKDGNLLPTDTKVNQSNYFLHL